MKTGMEIAVIGMSCRYPGAGNLEEFWENLKQGKETISFFANNELRKNGVSEEELDNPNYVKVCGLLEGSEYFDAAFFGYTPKEAEIMDPQIRVFHECAWNALEDAGYDPGGYDGLIGLYAGATLNLQWLARVILTGKDNDIGSFAAQQLIHKDFLTLRISYKLDLKGPSFELSTACSTSLVAVHVACQALLNGECDMAMAGGIRISNLEKRGYLYQEGMIPSPDGHCRAFDAGAKGTLGSDGAGVVVLKGLEDAVLDRDHIYAIIKGTAINNDGVRKAGFSASSVAGQAEVIRTALQVAEVEPETIGYIEAHGTGTGLGDPVEIEGLKSAFKTAKKSFCALGSVKSNIGHTDAAAGAAGFIKTVLALKYRLIPPTLHFEVPNPYIDFINTPFYIDTHLSPWEKDEYPRRAGVSSFGIGGTNAHVIVEEWPGDTGQKVEVGENRLILLSACTGPALDRMKENLAGFLQRHPGINLEDTAYTLQVGRKAFNHRWMTVCSTTAETITALAAPDAGETHVCGMETENSEPIELEPGIGKDWMLQAGRWWLQGQKINWQTLYPEEKPCRLSLPLYPFEKQRYWPDFENPVITVPMMKTTKTAPGMAGQLTSSHPRPNLSSTYTTPGNSIEQTLTGIWQNLLGFDKIGVKDNFLELGGDSLRAITLISRVHQEIGINIPVTEFFAHPTIEGIAGYILDSKNKISYTAIKPVEKKEYYSLSSSQLRIYFLHRMDPGSLSYNIPMAFVLLGKVNPSELECSFKKLIRRHESLRTMFIMSPQGTAQVIRDDAPFALEYFKCSESEVPAVYRDFVRPFHLEDPPLLRIGLIETSQMKHILLLDIFHIIADGFSLDNFVKEFITLSRGDDLLPLEIHYKDFSHWQNQWKRDGALAKQEAYWKKQFGDEIPLLDLPTDNPRPPEQDFAGNSITFALAEGEANALKILALQEGTTLYVVLLALYYIFLAKLSNQEDIVVGTPTAGRRHTELEKIIGMFVNTLALRNYPTAGKRIADFLGEVKENTFNAFENQDYPYEELVEQAAVNRDLSRNPLFDTMFTLQKIEVKAISLPDLDMAPYFLENKTAKFDLSLTAMEFKDKLEFTIEFSTNLFEKNTIERFSGYFKKIAGAVSGSKSKEMTIKEIEIIPVEEKKKILYEFNDTAMEYPGDKTIQQLFAEQTEKNPDHMAIAGQSFSISPMPLEFFPNENESSSLFMQLSYRELSIKSHHMALSLQEKGVEPDTIVGIKIERSLEMMIGILGILKAGGAYLPIDPSYPRERIDYMLNDSSARILLTAENLESFINSTTVSHKSNMSYMSDIPPGAKKIPTPGHRPPATSLAYVIYTSGTTGKPKGVMIEHKSVINFIKGITDIVPFTSNDCILSLTTFSFDIFGLETLVPLTKGTKVIIGSKDEQLEPGKIARAIEKEHISIFQVIPTRLKLILTDEEASGSLKRLKYLLVGGEEFPQSLLEEVKYATGGNIYNVYGPTETTIWSTIKELRGARKITIGGPIVNTWVFICDKYGHFLPLGVTGELYIGGDGLARGYINKPGVTAEKFIPFPHQLNESHPYEREHSKHNIQNSRLYKTGDLACWLPEGFIKFLGRIDTQIKIRGHRIELNEIETLLQKNDKINEAMVFVKQRGDNKYLYAAIVTNELVETAELKNFLSQHLPDYMIPSHFIQLEQMPLTSNGKIDRKILEAKEGLQLEIGHTYVAPETEREKIIARLWQEVLMSDKVGIEDNFFDLGGNSMSVIQLNKRINETLNTDVPMVSMFKYTTIQSFLKYLSEEEGEGKSIEKQIDESMNLQDESLMLFNTLREY